MRASATTNPGVLVPRDREIEGWIDRVGAAGVEQVRQRFGLGRTQAYKRLRVLVALGLLRTQRLTVEIPLLWLPPRESVGLSRIEHLYRATGLVTALEANGRQVVTERELRRARRNPDAAAPAVAQELPTLLGCERTPDAVEVGTDGLTAYELELSSKGKARRRQIFGAYATSSYLRVVWIAPSAQLAALLEREIDESGLVRLMEVRNEH